MKHLENDEVFKGLKVNDGVEHMSSVNPYLSRFKKRRASLLSVNDLNFYVAPKETDMIMKKASELIGYSVNMCFNKELEYEEMISLVNS